MSQKGNSSIPPRPMTDTFLSRGGNGRREEGEREEEATNSNTHTLQRGQQQSSSTPTPSLSPFVGHVAYAVEAHRVSSAKEEERRKAASLVARQRAQQGTLATTTDAALTYADTHPFTNPYTAHTANNPNHIHTGKLFITTKAASGVGAVSTIPVSSSMAQHYRNGSGGHHRSVSPTNITTTTTPATSSSPSASPAQQAALRTLEQPVSDMTNLAEAQFAGKAFAGLSAAASVVHLQFEGHGAPATMQSTCRSQHESGGSADADGSDFTLSGAHVSRPLSRLGGGGSRGGTGLRTGSGGGVGNSGSPNTRLPGPEKAFAHAQNMRVLAAVAAQSATQFGTTRPMSSSRSSITITGGGTVRSRNSVGGGEAEGAAEAGTSPIPLQRVKGGSVGIGEGKALVLVDSTSIGVVTSEPSAAQPSSTSQSQPSPVADKSHLAPNASSSRKDSSPPLPSFYEQGYLLDEKNYTNKHRHKAPLSIIESRKRRAMNVSIDALRREQEVHALQREFYDGRTSPSDRRQRHLAAQGGSAVATSLSSLGIDISVHTTNSDQNKVAAEGNGGEERRGPTSPRRQHAVSCQMPMDPLRPIVHDSSGILLPAKLINHLPASIASLSGGGRVEAEGTVDPATVAADGVLLSPRQRRALLEKRATEALQAAGSGTAVVDGSDSITVNTRHEGIDWRASTPHGNAPQQPPELGTTATELSHHPSASERNGGRRAASEDGNGNQLSVVSTARALSPIAANTNINNLMLSPLRSKDQGHTNNNSGGASIISPLPRPASRLRDLRYTSAIAAHVANTPSWTPQKSKRDTVQLMRRERLHAVNLRREQDVHMCELQFTAIKKSGDFWRRNPSPDKAMKQFNKMVLLSEVAKSSDGTLFLGGSSSLASSSSPQARPSTTTASSSMTHQKHAEERDQRDASMSRYLQYHSQITGKQYHHRRSTSAASSSHAADGSGGDARGTATTPTPTKAPLHLRQGSSRGGYVSKPTLGGGVDGEGKARGGGGGSGRGSTNVSTISGTSLHPDDVPFIVGRNSKSGGGQATPPSRSATSSPAPTPRQQSPTTALKENVVKHRTELKARILKHRAQPNTTTAAGDGSSAVGDDVTFFITGTRSGSAAKNN